MLTLTNSMSGLFRINGVINVRTFAKGEKIYISQTQYVTLITAKAGISKSIVILTVKDNKNKLFTIKAQKDKRGKNLYKIKKFL